MLCEKCGSVPPAGAKFCVACGSELPGADAGSADPAVVLDLRHAREATRALESATAALAAVGFATSAARIVGDSDRAAQPSSADAGDPVLGDWDRESEDAHHLALEPVEPTVPVSADGPDEILDVPTVSATGQVGTVARRSRIWLVGTVVLVVVLASVVVGLMYVVVLYLRS